MRGRVFTHMGERQVFGGMALLDGEPRTATIRTTQPTRLLRKGVLHLDEQVYSGDRAV